MEFPLGFIVGAAMACALWAVVIIAGIVPQTQGDQFTKDCKAMAHGTVSGSFCMHGNTVLFRK